MTTLPFHNIVTNRGWVDNDSVHTFNIGLAADGSAITQADVGRVVSIDASGPNKVRLAQTGDAIFGLLVSVGFPNAAGPGVCGVASRFIEKIDLLAADTAVVGSTVVGSTSGAAGDDARGGYVKAATANDIAQNIVLEKDPNNVFVVVARV